MIEFGQIVFDVRLPKIGSSSSIIKRRFDV